MSAEEPSSSGRSSATTTLLAVSVLCVLLLTAAAHPESHAVPAEGTDDGMSILYRAAEAEAEVAYTAVREVAGPVAEQGQRSDVRVVNQPGEGLALAPLGEEEYAFVVRASSALEALDERLLDMLSDTYAVADEGVTEMDGRAVHLVEATRADHSLAGRFWVDADTGLLLGRTIYEQSEEVAYSSRLTELELGDGHWPENAAGDEPWGHSLNADDRAALRDEGWEVPEHLAWNLRLVTARMTQHEGHRVVHVVYSDGLSRVSVFAQRGKLGAEHSSTLHSGYVGTDPGASGVIPQHDTIFGGDVGQYQSMWQASGFVFIVLADAPTGLASSAVTALPEPESPGFWGRVQRGLDRLGLT